MEPIYKEDYSVDMRTILAKERTLMSQQRLQLNLIGIGLGLFATGFTLLKLFETNDPIFLVVEITFIFGGAILATIAVLQYYHLAKELQTFEVMETELVHAFRSSTMEKMSENAFRKKEKNTLKKA